MQARLPQPRGGITAGRRAAAAVPAVLLLLAGCSGKPDVDPVVPLTVTPKGNTAPQAAGNPLPRDDAELNAAMAAGRLRYPAGQAAFDKVQADVPETRAEGYRQLLAQASAYAAKPEEGDPVGQLLAGCFAREPAEANAQVIQD